MLLLRNEDVFRLLTWELSVSAIERGLKEQFRGAVHMPRRLTFDSGNGWLRLMPVSLPGMGYMGFKAMHSTNGVGVGYFIHLYNVSTGELLALMDADRVTLVRTAATSAVAAGYLARTDCDAVGLLGSGEQARAQLEALLAVRRFTRVKVYSPNPEHREGFSRMMQERLRVSVNAVDSPRAAVAGSDMVLVAIRAGADPVLFADWLEPGMFVSGISSVQAHAREVEEAVWLRSDRVVVDDLEHVLESGDGRSVAAHPSWNSGGAGELWEIASGTRPARTDERQITLFKSVGTAIQDVVTAAAVYEAAVQQGAGLKFEDFPRLRPMRSAPVRQGTPNPANEVR